MTLDPIAPGDDMIAAGLGDLENRVMTVSAETRFHAKPEAIHSADDILGRLKSMGDCWLHQGYDDREMRVVFKDGSSFPISELLPRWLVAGKDYEVE